MEDLSERADLESVRSRVFSRDSGFSKLQLDGEETIPQMFSLQVQRHPRKHAIVSDERSLTFQELDELSCAVGQAIATAVKQARRPIAVLISDHANLAAAILGILRAGQFYVPLDPSYPIERNSLILKEARACALLTERANEPLARQLSVPEQPVWCVDDIEHAASSGSERSRADALAYVIFTSGSTGVPKGVTHTHRNLLQVANRYTTALHLGYRDRVSLLSSCSVTASVPPLLGSLLCGATVHGFSVLKHGLGALADWLDSSRITVYDSGPLLFRHLMRSVAASRRFSNLQIVRLASDAVYKSDWELFVQHCPSDSVLINVYGCSELPTVSAFYADQSIPVPDGTVPVGYPIQGVEILVTNEDGDAALSEESGDESVEGPVGEIVLRSRYISPGYWRDVIEREPDDRPSFGSELRSYRTGDLGAIRHHGLVHLGRGDLQTKISGFRLEIGEVEANLRGYPGVAEAAVTVREDDPGNKHLVGYIVADLALLKSREAIVDLDVRRADVLSQQVELYPATHPLRQRGHPLSWIRDHGRQGFRSQAKTGLQDIVLRVRSLNPPKVLEIGCGGELLVEHVAPHCEVYHCAESSRASVQQLQECLHLEPQLSHVTVERCSPLEVQGPPGGFDAVILNSVVQYFPDSDYLFSVLQHAVGLVSKGGHIFIGNVRHLGLLQAFHSATQLAMASEDTPVEFLGEDITHAVNTDPELVLHPDFFEKLPRRLPNVSGAQVLLKRGRVDEALTGHLYDVVLEIGGQRRSAAAERLRWDDVGTTASLSEVLRSKRLEHAVVSRIPNRRLSRDLAAARLIESSDASVVAAKLREDWDQISIEGEDPEAFWKWGEEQGLDVQVRWSPESEPGHFDVEIADSARAIPSVSIDTPGAPTPLPIGPRPDANDPWGRSLQQKLIRDLAHYAEREFPSYMVPSVLVAMDALPLTPNGKVARQALPAPPAASRRRVIYEPPSAGVETALAGIWQDTLGVERVGRNANLIELGGRSITAAALVGKIAQQFGVHIQVPEILRNPDFKSMAQAIETLMAETATRATHAGMELEEGVI